MLYKYKHMHSIQTVTQMQGNQGQFLCHLINNRELRQMTGGEAEHHPLQLSLKHHTRSTHTDRHTHPQTQTHTHIDLLL